MNSGFLVALCALASAHSAAAQAGAYGNSGSILALMDRGTRLVSFHPGQPGRILSAVDVTGLASNEVLFGIDVRPSTGELLGLSSQNRLYHIDVDTGLAFAIGSFVAPLTGSNFGLDVNPVPDRVRVVNERRENLRLNPNTGALAALDPALSYWPFDVNSTALPRVVAAAYTNSFAGASSTTNYAIDSALDVLVTQGSVNGAPISPNTGLLFTVGALGIDVVDVVGFDIAPFGGAFLAAAATNGADESSLYAVNLATGAATLLGPIGGGRVRDIAVRAPRAPRVFGVTDDQRLVSFQPGTPSALLSNLPIGGLPVGETLLGIDVRPSTGELYALGASSRLYVVDPSTAQATPLGAAPFAPALSGSELAFDFNPVPDRVRVVTNAGQNLRLHPVTGAVAGTDTPVDFAPGDVNAGQPRDVVACAYTNDFAGASVTTLFAIDAGLDVLVTQGGVDGTPSPNGGQLFTRGALGVDTNEFAGFDISPLGGALASLTPVSTGFSQLYTLNPSTGAATAIGPIGVNLRIRDIAIEPPGRPLAVGVDASNQLVSFVVGRPEAPLASVAISGLLAGETIVGLDVRPSTGQLLAIGSTSRVYRLALDSGTAFALGLPFVPALSGVSFGGDVNPVPDRLRIVSDADQNLRLVPGTGTIASVDPLLTFDAGDPNSAQERTVVACAYTNNFAGARATTLYGIESNLDVLVRQGSINGAPVSANSGVLFTVGALGIDVGAECAFDISVHGGALAAILRSGQTTSELVRVDLATGQLTALGSFATGTVVRTLALVPPGL